MPRHTCSYCGGHLRGTPWVVLNRAMFGSGRAWMASEFHNDDGDYWWQVDDDGAMNETVVTGPVLCFPACLTTFIEGRMIQAEIVTGKSEDEPDA